MKKNKKKDLGKTKKLTIAQLPGKTPRRIDFLYSPPDEYAFAVLYFTGSKDFNVAMRGRATKIGYTLNEHGISTFTGKTKGDKIAVKFSSRSNDKAAAIQRLSLT